MVLAPKGPVDPLASRLPSGDSARQAGHVASSCRPCSVRRHTQCRVDQAWQHGEWSGDKGSYWQSG